MLLYPRERPLKDVLTTLKKDGHNSLVVLGWENGFPTSTKEFQADSVENRMYNAVTEYFYYADIASDSDEQFMQRFTNRWNMHAEEYKALLSKLKVYDGDKETLSINGTNVRSVSKTNSETNGGSDMEADTGDITYNKGVTTESTQNTTNTGNKLTRTTPNEEMTVDGNATTTVTDSGNDSEVRNVTKTTTYGKTVTNNEDYDDELTVETDNVRSKVSADNLLAIAKFNNIVREFVYLFENLFMGVL